MKTVRSNKFNITITWTNEPCEGKPLTRIWTGPNHQDEIHTSRRGATITSRDREITSLADPVANAQLGHDWVAG